LRLPFTDPTKTGSSTLVVDCRQAKFLNRLRFHFLAYGHMLYTAQVGTQIAGLLRIFEKDCPSNSHDDAVASTIFISKYLCAAA
jgi:hypothetical protein